MQQYNYYCMGVHMYIIYTYTAQYSGLHLVHANNRIIYVRFLTCHVGTAMLACYQADQASQQQQENADHPNPPDTMSEEVLRLISGMMKDMEQLKQDVVAVAQRLSSLEQKVDASLPMAFHS